MASGLIDWQDGAMPLSRRFGDCFFSRLDGLAETRHVFLVGNDLPARFTAGFHIAELGFGTGLNLFAALHAWRAAGAPGRLRFTSFEAFPLSAEEMARALARFPEIAPLATPFLEQWAAGAHRVVLRDLDAEVVIGDARTGLPRAGLLADAWFLDGFAPARNPELWEPALLAQVARHTAPDGTFATYTAAGVVRRALACAGFKVTRQPGFGRKRHMTAGRLSGEAHA